jgi:hypothetical protein
VRSRNAPLSGRRLPVTADGDRSGEHIIVSDITERLVSGTDLQKTRVELPASFEPLTDVVCERGRP